MTSRQEGVKSRGWWDFPHEKSIISIKKTFRLRRSAESITPLSYRLRISDIFSIGQIKNRVKKLNAISTTSP